MRRSRRYLSAASREERQPSDPESVVALLMEQFERSGDGNVRLALLHERIEAVRAGLEQGRANHQRWLAEVFEDRLPSDPAERRRTLAALHAATDVYTPGSCCGATSATAGAPPSGS
jgi:hypothetical protein